MLSCPICNTEYCYCRNHIKLCKCGFYDSYKYMDKNIEGKIGYAVFQCNNCGNIRKMELFSRQIEV